MAARVRLTSGAYTARKVTLNRAALDAITLAAADGMLELAKAIVTEARVPDAPLYGEGLVEKGGAIAYVGRKLVGSHGGELSKAAVRTRSRNEAAGAPRLPRRRVSQQVKKPSAGRLDPRGGVVVFGGYGFPGRLVEGGTVKMAPHPFLTPSLLAHIPDARGFVALAMQKHRIVSAARRGAGDVVGGAPTAEGVRYVRGVRRALAKVGP